MWAKLDYKKKNFLVYLLMLSLAYVSWVLSFEKAWKAFRLYQELTQAQSENQGMDVTAPFVRRKNDFFQELVKSYNVKKPDVEGHIWQVVSGIAINRGVDISIESPVENTQDSVQHSKTYDFFLKGDYIQMVKFLDSVNATKGIGRPSSIELSKARHPDDKSDNLSLWLKLSVIR